MARFSLVVLQLFLAALVGYYAGRYAQAPPADRVPPPATAPLPQSSPPAPPAALPPVATATGAALSTSFRNAVEHAAPSVLTVHSARTAARGPFGLGGRGVLSVGLGSGVLIDGDGYVVTNNHVVQDA